MGLESDVSANLAKTYGEENRCPACGAFARVDRDPELRFVCAVCGAPRIGGKAKQSEDTNRSLAAAGKAKRSAFAWRAGSWALGIPAAFALILAAVLAPQSFLASGILIGAGVFLAIFSARASRTARTERKKVLVAWSEAWESATLALLARKGDKQVTAEEVGKELDLPTADAEVLLNTLSAQSSVRVRIDENEAKLTYESEVKSEPKAEAEAEAEAETEAEAEAEAEAEKAKS